MKYKMDYIANGMIIENNLKNKDYKRLEVYKKLIEKK